MDRIIFIIFTVIFLAVWLNGLEQARVARNLRVSLQFQYIQITCQPVGTQWNCKKTINKIEGK